MDSDEYELRMSDSEPPIKKEKLNTESLSDTDISNLVNFQYDITQFTRYNQQRLNQKAKTSTERSREHRARKKFAQEQEQEQQQNVIIKEEILSEDDFGGSSQTTINYNDIPSTSSFKHKKTSAERTRRWRERKGLRSASRIKTKPKTVAERSREYRERKKLKLIQSQIGLTNRNNQYQDDEYEKLYLTDLFLNSKYDDYEKNKKAHEKFSRKFKANSFGHACTVCERLWFKNDLKIASINHENILKKITNINIISEAMICGTCRTALDSQKIPILSTYNGFKYPKIPLHLPKLDFISERLISPRIPFMQIRRLRHINKQYGIYGQVINIPFSINSMVNQLPRNINDNHCIYVNIEKKKIYKFNDLQELINKRNIKIWLQYLINTPLFTAYNITIDNSFFDDDDDDDDDNDDNEKFKQTQIKYLNKFSEIITVKDTLIAQQQTLLWNDEKLLKITSDENNIPTNILFDENNEELSFPTIYIGQFRKFRNEIKSTPFLIASSELRRQDRRGVTPHHLLYIAMKIMRTRIRDYLTVAFNNIGIDNNITQHEIKSGQYINNCIESKLASLQSIPNSIWYCTQKKKNLFAIIRQKGKPTAFMTLYANESGWSDLLRLLYKLQNNGCEISKKTALELSDIEKNKLINEDAVTCVIYFNKLIDVLLDILQSKECSPFGQYRLINFFKRIEFQHNKTPRAHILLWLENAPNDILGKNYDKTIDLIENLVSVSESQSSKNIELQIHKHNFTCYNDITENKLQKCHFEIPYMPCNKTMILTPMNKTDKRYKKYSQRYIDIKTNLETTYYNTLEDFYINNNIKSHDEYQYILRAGIKKPKIFYKRQPNEKLHIPFNPFILNILASTVNFQIIPDEYTCAEYIVQYINKTNRGISNLQCEINKLINDNSEFDIEKIIKKINVDMLNSVEMSSKEAAWYLLREPMFKSSINVCYINTVLPEERQRIRRTQKQLIELDEDSINIWKEDWFDKYEKRPVNLEDISLAQFVSKYYKNKNCIYVERKEPQVIRYCNFNITENYNEYRREMVTLHMPFRNENTEILFEMKYNDIYDQNEELILEKKKEFESNLDIDEMIEFCKQLNCEYDEPDNDDENEIQDIAKRFSEVDPFQKLHDNFDNEINSVTSNKMNICTMNKINTTEFERFCKLIKSTDNKQKSLFLYFIHNILSINSSPVQIFFTESTRSMNAFIIKLVMKIYNRLSENDEYFNAFIVYPSNNKSDIVINETSIRTALKISCSKLLLLSIESTQQYHSLFKNIEILIIDEMITIENELLIQIDLKLKQITRNNDTNFGGLNVILIENILQSIPIQSTTIYKLPKQHKILSKLWRDLKFIELSQVIQEANVTLSLLLSKIGNDSILSDKELDVLESRIYTREEVDEICPHGVRLFLTDNSVNEYNNLIVESTKNSIVSLSIDTFFGCQNNEEKLYFKQKIQEMSLNDTGGFPNEILFILHKFYIVTTNIDVSDGLANGIVGKLVHIEKNEQNQVTRVWLIFPNSPETGDKLRKKAHKNIDEHNIDHLAVPIERRTYSIPINNDKKIVAQRTQFPLRSGFAMTIHKSQNEIFNEIVYEYNETHSMPLLHIALSRVLDIQGLYIVTSNDNLKFYHCQNNHVSIDSLEKKFEILSLNRLMVVGQMVNNFVDVKIESSIFKFNLQNLKKYFLNTKNSIINHNNVLLLSESIMDINTDINISNFDCIVKFEQNKKPKEEIQVCNSDNNITNIITSNMNILLQHVNELSVDGSTVGEICTAECVMENERKLITVIVYIFPNANIEDIILFLHIKLLIYTPKGSQLLDENNHTLPMILYGNFNMNFESDNAKRLIEFFHKNLQLSMKNDPEELMKKYGTTIDTIFGRYLEKLDSRTYISYFSHHKPILPSTESTLNISDIPMDDDNVIETLQE